MKDYPVGYSKARNSGDMAPDLRDLFHMQMTEPDLAGANAQGRSSLHCKPLPVSMRRFADA